MIPASVHVSSFVRLPPKALLCLRISSLAASDFLVTSVVPGI